MRVTKYPVITICYNKKKDGAADIMIKVTNHPWIKNAVILTLIIITTLFSIEFFAKTSFDYDSFSFTIQSKISVAGGTILEIPPVGQLFLKSHHTPWQLVITLNEINFNKLEQQLTSLASKEELLDLFQIEVKKALFAFIGSVFLCGIIATALLLCLLRIYPSDPWFGRGLFASVLVMTLFIGLTAATYDQNAIKHPQYQGALESAPWAMNLVSMSLDNIEVLGSSLRKVSEGLPMLYKQAVQIQNMGELQPDLAVLHVSDIHNNPAAFEFIQELVANFNIKLIIDTGDVTDYGTALEADIVSNIEKFKIPYVFIPGNHDSPLIIERLKQIKNVRIIDKTTETIAGLTIAGIGDPAADSFNSDVSPTEVMDARRTDLNEYLASLEQQPDIVAVHNRQLAKDIIGKYPLILHGHDHKYNLSIVNGTILHDAGTTGAAGIRGLTAKGVPYSAAILYWKKTEDGSWKLQAIDSIKVNGTEGRLTIDRHSYS